MKNLVYILLVSLIYIGCSEKKNETHNGYTVIVAPDSVWDYSYLDSLHHVIKCESYQTYGDSNMLDRIVMEGLPDSMKLHNN